MTLSTTASRISYAGDAVSTVFSYPYYFKAQADLVVKLYNTSTGAVTAQVLTTNYTISGTVDPDFGYSTGGSVTMLVAPPSGTSLVIYRDPAPLQSLSVPTSGPLPSKPIESELDLITMIAQRTKDQSSRAVTLNDGMAAAFDPTLPATLALNPSTAIVVNAAGTGLDIGPTITAISSAAANAAAAALSASQAAAYAAQAALSTNYYAGTSGGSANAQTLTPTIPLVAYVAGIRYSFEAGFTNTGAATINISGLGAKALRDQSGAALSAGEITAGRTYNIVYSSNGTFVIAELSTPEDNSVSTAKIIDGAVTTTKILDANVTNDKLDTSTTTFPTDLKNISISVTMAANAATIALKTKAGADASSADYITTAFRSATLTNGAYVTRKITGALSTVISSGSTGGTANAVSQNIHVYLIDNAGTAELAWGNWRIYDESVLYNTTAEGGAGAADSNNVLYSTTARTSVAVRYIGYFTSTQATAGTWVTAASAISVNPSNRQIHLRSQVRVHTSNGRGSTNTVIRRFTTVVDNYGTAITYADSATLGATFTLNEDGVYAINHFMDVAASGSIALAGISLNSSQLTTTINTITTADVLAIGEIEVAAQTDPSIAAASWTGFLRAGDIIRAHGNTSNDPASASKCQFTICKVAN